MVLWNDEAECMEGSMTSVYFWRSGRWTTPGLQCGGNNGTTRRWLLERGVVREDVVLVQTVGAGEVVLMSNGVRGVWAGVVEAAWTGDVRGRAGRAGWGDWAWGGPSANRGAC